MRSGRDPVSVPLAKARHLEGMALPYVNLLIQDPPHHFEYHLRPR
jgi:hypothetical protein